MFTFQNRADKEAFLSKGSYTLGTHFLRAINSHVKFSNCCFCYGFFHTTQILRSKKSTVFFKQGCFFFFCCRQVNKCLTNNVERNASQCNTTHDCLCVSSFCLAFLCCNVMQCNHWRQISPETKSSCMCLAHHLHSEEKKVSLVPK